MAILTTRVEGEVYIATTWSAIEDEGVAIVEIEAVVTDDTFLGVPSYISPFIWVSSKGCPR